MMSPFEEIKDDQLFVGSKAFVLAQMSKRGLPVPKGLILTKAPETLDQWNYVFSWWESHHQFPLAVRSSAFGEDSFGLSFAGNVFHC